MTLDAAEYKDVIFVTFLWVVQIYFFMQLGPSAALSGKSSAQVTWGKRAFGNMSEQAVMFILALWIHAIFTSPADAAQLGLVYLGLRVGYLLIWLMSGKFTLTILAVTMPMYGIILYLLGSTAIKAQFGFDVNSFLQGMPLVLG
jgi:hypothetical protein